MIISKIANKKEGIALPITTATLDHISSFSPSLTAFEIPKGIDIRYTNKVVHNPKEMDTGNLSLIKSITFLS